MRRGDSERIYFAKRAGFLARLASQLRMSEERAEGLLATLEAEWAAQGRQRDSVEFWAEAERRASGPQ
ncbi:MAG TPA: hypothetical protein VKR30_02595 [Candidatus Limnocylindrales bacterium]|nr:hypothetical protein [Candidatus Limnocylindrales bacterium]